jgi:hypothetical protein
MSAKELLKGSQMGGSGQNCYLAGVNVPVFNDGIERKFQLGVKGSEVDNLWREIGAFLASYEMLLAQELASVGSVHLDDQDHDRCLVAPEKPQCQKEKSRCGAILEV